MHSVIQSFLMLPKTYLLELLKTLSGCFRISRFGPNPQVVIYFKKLLSGLGFDFG